MDIHLDNAVGYAPYPGVQSNGNPDTGAVEGGRTRTKDVQAKASGGVSQNPLSLKDITTLITTMDMERGNLVRVLDSVSNENSLRSLLKHMQ